MASFFARVELHGARWPDDYAKLHAALSEHGFTNRLVSTSGLLKLPSGFYYSTNRIDNTQRVATAVKACADRTGFKNEVIVVKSLDDPSAWSSFLSKI